MKNLLLALMLTLPIYSYTEEVVKTTEQPVTVTTTEAAVVAEPVVASDETVPTTSAAETAVVDEPKAEPALISKEVIMGLIAAIIALLAPLVIIAYRAGVKKLESKLGYDFPEAVETIAEGLLVKGINYVENKASSTSLKPKSESKLSEALRYATEQAKGSEMVKSYINDHGAALIEKLLKSEVTPNSATPK